MLGRKGASSTVRIRWTDEIAGNVNDVSDAQAMGAVW